MDGTEGDAAQNVRRLASNLARSVVQPVYLQDERLTSFAATENLKAEGLKPEDIPALVDGEAAATILRDFRNRSGTNARRSVRCHPPIRTQHR